MVPDLVPNPNPNHNRTIYLTQRVFNYLYSGPFCRSSGVLLAKQ